MATVKESMAATHQQAADFHKRVAESHQALSECFKGMCKSTLPLRDGLEGASNHHAAIAKAHEDAAAFHSENCKTLKSAVEADLNKLQRDGYSSVIPSDVPPAFGIRAVPRAGGPELPTALDKSAIDPRFRHLITTDEA